MSHDEASELLGAYALDAVDGDECSELEAHLETCPRCRAELDSLREVAAAMGNSVEPLPEGLWSQIASACPSARRTRSRRRCRGWRRRPAHPSGRPPTAARRRRRIMVGTMGAVAVAAAAVAVVLGIGLVRADDKVSNLQSAASGPAA